MTRTASIYMNKLAVGPEAAGVVDINAPVATNLQNVAKAKGMQVPELTVCVLDRPRHADLVKEIRAAGARIKFISDGDVAGCIMTCLPETGVDIYLGTGGATECVIYRLRDQVPRRHAASETLAPPGHR